QELHRGGAVGRHRPTARRHDGKRCSMHIGIPREVRDGEARVGMPPVGARQLVGMGHQVFVERGAGERSGFGDDAYIEAAAAIVSAPAAVYWRADLVIKVVRPTEAEFALLREDSALIAF